MTYSNYANVDYTKLSPWYYNRNGKRITKITVHHAAVVNASLESLGVNYTQRQCSTNYGIDSNGRIGLYVPEQYGAWASCSESNDSVAVTIEVMNSGAGPNWPVSAKAWDALVKLCVDVCKRNGIEKLNYTGDKNGNLTRHNMFIATACPGPYLQGKFPELAKEVNKRLGISTPIQPEPSTPTIYRVQVGAYSKEENAIKIKDKLVKDGYSTYLVQTDGLYKVQVGAYTVEKNAKRMEAELKAKGYDTYITSKTSTVVDLSIKVGSRVKIKQGAKTYYGGNLASFVYDRINVVSQIQNDRVVVTYDGVVVAAVHIDDLIRV